VKLLVNDERVDINQTDEDGITPFSIACKNGHTEIVKCLFASGREIILPSKSNNQNMMRILKREIKPEIFELLESFENNPNGTRNKLRIELGFAGNNVFYFYFIFIYSLHFNSFHFFFLLLFLLKTVMLFPFMQYSFFFQIII